MSKRTDKRDYDYIPSYICTKCGYATISEELPEKCEKCTFGDFEIVKIKSFKDARRTFALDDRQVGPI